MRRQAVLLFWLFLGCAHVPAALVASMTTLGPRVLVIAAEEPLVVSGDMDALCIACPPGWTVEPSSAALTPPGGVPIAIQAVIAAEDDGSRVELPRVSERRLGEESFLCLGPKSALQKGARYTRATVRAGESLRVSQIVWIGAGH
jgi:hypothetical protein